MKQPKDVHTEHCCLIHGCKYCDPDCTVTQKRAEQSYVCESCSEFEEIKSVEQLKATYPQEFGIKLRPLTQCGHDGFIAYVKMQYIQHTILNKLSRKDLKHLLILAGIKVPKTKEAMVAIIGEKLS